MGAQHTGCCYSVFAESLKSCLISSKRKKAGRGRYRSSLVMSLAYCISCQTKFKPVIASIMNIWASTRTMKSKRIPRNDFIWEQNLQGWPGELSFFYLMSPACEPSQERLLGSCTTTDINVSMWGNTNARLFPGDFYWKCEWWVLDHSRCYCQEEDNVSSNASAAQIQTDKTSGRRHFPASYPEFTYWPVYCGPTFSVQIFRGLEPLTPKAWFFPAI